MIVKATFASIERLMSEGCVRNPYPVYQIRSDAVSIRENKTPQPDASQSLLNCRVKADPVAAVMSTSPSSSVTVAK